MIETED